MEHLKFLLRLDDTDFQAHIQDLELDWIPLILPLYQDEFLYRFLYRLAMHVQLNRNILKSIVQVFKSDGIIDIIKAQLDKEVKNLVKKVERGKSKITQEDVKFLNLCYGIIDFDPMILTGLYLNSSRETKLNILEIFYKFLHDTEIPPELIENGGSELLVDQPLILDYVILFKHGSKWSSQACEIINGFLTESGTIWTSLPPDLTAFVDRIKVEPVEQIQPEITEDEIIDVLKIHDLFPDLGHGFIHECLQEFKDVEIVIMKLLEGDLPERLCKLDRSMPLGQVQTVPSKSDALPAQESQDIQEPMEKLTIHPPALPPRQDFLSDRRNIFDGDKFDIFTNNIDPSLVHVGKKE